MAMTVEAIKERLNKAEENVAKRIKTTEKFNAQLVKLVAKLQRCSWIDVENLSAIMYDDSARARYKAETGDDLYWDICDVHSKESDIKESGKKLVELNRIVDGWKEKLSKAEAVDDMWTKTIPECLKQYKDKLTEEWDAWDKSRREKLRSEYKALGYDEFIKKYKYVGYTFKSMTDEQIHEENEREATNLIMDLYSRVYKYVGKITDWRHLYIKQFHINGVLTGELGKCTVDSILAGGYNIQRLHVRVLVHKWSEQVVEEAPAKKEVTKVSKVTQSSSEYSKMTITELEQLVAQLGSTCKKYDNERIYRMRLVMAVKAAKA